MTGGANTIIVRFVSCNLNDVLLYTVSEIGYIVPKPRAMVVWLPILSTILRPRPPMQSLVHLNRYCFLPIVVLKIIEPSAFPAARYLLNLVVVDVALGFGVCVGFLV